MRAALAFLLASAFGVSLGGCGSETKKELVVGVLLPMTGDTATYGEESMNGIRIAEKEIRAKDPSFQFRIELADDQSRKELAGAQTKKLIENLGASIVVGSVASSNTMGAAIVCKEAGVPLLTPASTNDTLTDDTAKYGSNVFRVCFKDSFQGTMLARFAKNTLKASTAAEIIDKGAAYSVGLAEQFEKEWLRLGGTVVATEYYTKDDKDFTTLVQKVGSAKPAVILASGYYPQVGPMVRQGKEAWKGIPVIGGDGLDSEKLIQLVGDADNPVYFTSHFVATDADPVVAEFVRKYRDAFGGQVPGAMAALGYDAMYAVHEAALRARKAHPSDPNTPEHVSEGLRGLEFTGVTGKIRIGPDRTPKKSIVIVQLASPFKFVEKIQPE